VRPSVKDILIDDEDRELLSKVPWRVSHRPNSGTGYAICVFYSPKRLGEKKRKQNFFYLHRVLMGVSKRDVDVDHINGNGLDNRKANLRIANASKNGMNRSRPNKNNLSGYRGISLDKRTWFARLVVNRKCINLGRFKTKEEAARAYDRGARKYFGEFCGYLNFPEER
jgi:AP2 domain